MSAPSTITALAVGAAAVVAVMATTAGIAKRSGKAAYVDAAWGASFVAFSWAVVVALLGSGQAPSWRAWILVALVTIWGCRLTWHLALRARSTRHDDPRYEDYLGGPIRSMPFVRVIVKVFALQAILVVVVALPLLTGVLRPTHGWWLVPCAVGLWAVGLVFEAVSDAQLAAYRSDPERPRILSTGLWAWSRHPNYFGDFCVWWGFWLIGGAAVGWREGLLTLLSPVLMSWILIGVSGVRLAEKRMQGRPGWTAYRARTPIFFPRPPSQKNPIQ